jgi:hypothetical protein
MFFALKYVFIYFFLNPHFHISINPLVYDYMK